MLFPHDILQTIGDIRIPIYPTEYQLVWGPSPSGKFSIHINFGSILTTSRLHTHYNMSVRQD